MGTKTIQEARRKLSLRLGYDSGIRSDVIVEAIEKLIDVKIEEALREAKYS